jgi:SAM-dependent methyltransferase
VTRRPSRSPWWRSGYFDDAYFALHEPLFPEIESRREVAAMLELLGLPVGSRVLDVPCGWGRHTSLLAEAGLHAVGADLSLPLLRHAPRARTDESDHGTEPTGGAIATEVDAAGSSLDPGTESESTGRPMLGFAAADVRALPFRDGCFDAVVDVFTSLGLFADEADDVRALREIRRVLAAPGSLLLESMHRDEVIAAYAERDAWTLPDGTEIHVRRRFDPVTGVSRERLRWRRGDASGEKRHTLRLRTATEIDGLLRQAGFAGIAFFGDWDGRPLRHDSPRVIAVCSR